MLGQPASWQTVCRPSLFTRFCIYVYSGPIFARVLIHSGLRSMGVWLLRTSRRSILRPSGATADTSAPCSFDSSAYTRVRPYVLGPRGGQPGGTGWHSPGFIAPAAPTRPILGAAPQTR